MEGLMPDAMRQALHHERDQRKARLEEDEETVLAALRKFGDDGAVYRDILDAARRARTREQWLKSVLSRLEKQGRVRLWVAKTREGSDGMRSQPRRHAAAIEIPAVANG